LSVVGVRGSFAQKRGEETASGVVGCCFFSKQGGNSPKAFWKKRAVVSECSVVCGEWGVVVEVEVDICGGGGAVA
jgi:hypothetical protein